MKTKLLSALILGAAGLGHGAAQLNESVSVEGTYIPDIIMVDRIYTLPQRASALTLPAHKLTYELGGVAAQFDPYVMTMPATGWMASRRLPSTRGYLDLGLGSWLNSTLSAGYRFADTPDTKAGIRLQHNSTSLWKPHMSRGTDDVRRGLYDESIGFYANHAFKGAGTLDASLDWHWAWFNYYGYDPSDKLRDGGILTGDAATGLKAPTQTLNDVSFAASWQSERRPGSLDWNAAVDLRYFGYRSLALHTQSGYEAFKGDRETRFGVAGGVRMPWDSGSTAALDVRLDVVGYAGRPAAESGSTFVPGSPDTYAQLTLSPWYRFARGNLNVKAGVALDLTFNADGSEPGSHYSLLHLAPAVAIDWRRDAVGLYVHAEGGSQLQTLAGGSAWNLYQMPAVVSTQPVHSPLDARAGALFGPFSGFSAGVEVAYKIEQHRRNDVWYQVIMNQGVVPVYGLDTDGRDPMLGLPDRNGWMPGMTVQGFSLGVNAAYTYSPWVTLSGEAHWQPQKGETGYWNGPDRPRVTAMLQAESNPWSTLKVGVQYRYRGVRNVYSLYPSKPAQSAGGATVVVGEAGTEVASMRLPDITELNIKARYELTPTLGFWLQASNLLGNRNVLLPGLPTEGVTVTAGLHWLF